MKIKFDYYKESGKHYSEGEINMPHVDYGFEVWQKAKAMLIQGIRPGLVDGHEFNTVVTILEGEGEGLSTLFVRGQNL